MIKSSLRKKIMHECPEDFEEDLKDFIDEIEGLVNEIDNLLQIDSINDLDDITEAANKVENLLGALY